MVSTSFIGMMEQLQENQCLKSKLKPRECVRYFLGEIELPQEIKKGDKVEASHKFNSILHLIY